MDTQELFELIITHKKELQLPIQVQDGSEVISILYSKMIWYNELIENNVPEKQSSASFICSRLRECLQYTLSGNSVKANECMKKILKDDAKLGSKLSVKSLGECFEGDKARRLYKARGGGFYSYRKDEMFHIPFNKRGLVKNQRYSINGTPCLYLGTSAYVCWEELERVDISSFWVSRFEVVNMDMKILDLSYTIQDIQIIYKSNIATEEKKELLENYLLGWILQCACSISVRNKNRVFREEYIIPQLVMSNINSEDIDGVIYFSVKGDYLSGYTSYLMKNLAFPAIDYKIPLMNGTEIDKDLYKADVLSKKLVNAFKLTNPINMGLLLNLNFASLEMRRTNYLNEAKTKNVEPLSISKDYDRWYSVIELSDNYRMEYNTTNFYRVEDALDMVLADSINSRGNVLKIK